ncbi:hypothetical protein D3C72_1230990 [compost metagenome]
MRLVAVLGQHGVGQLEDVLAALAQRRNAQRQHAQPVEQVGAEASVALRGHQVHVRGRDDAQVQRDRLVPAQSRDGALLQEAQQRHLAFQRQVADLVEKQRAALRLLDPADLALVRAGERTLLVAEQFRLHQVRGDGAAVDGDERPLAPARGIVDRLRGQFLAGAGFAGDEYRRLVVRHLGQRAEHGAHSRALADHGAARRRLLHARAMQRRHAMRVLERVDQLLHRERRAHVVHAVVADQPAHALVGEHRFAGDGHPGDMQMLQCEFELAELGIGVFRLQVDHASSGRARAHHAFDVTDLLHAAQFPSRAEAGRVKTKIFMTRHDHDLCSA